MAKSLQQVLTEQYPDLPQHIYAIVVWDSVNKVAKFDARSWPYDIYATCPTQEQLDIWMA